MAFTAPFARLAKRNCSTLRTKLCSGRCQRKQGNSLNKHGAKHDVLAGEIQPLPGESSTFTRNASMNPKQRVNMWRCLDSGQSKLPKSCDQKTSGFPPKLSSGCCLLPVRPTPHRRALNPCCCRPKPANRLKSWKISCEKPETCAGPKQ